MRDAVRIVLEEVSESTSDTGEKETDWNKLITGAWVVCLVALSISAVITSYLTKVVNQAQSKVEPDAHYSESELNRDITRYMGNWQ